MKKRQVMYKTPIKPLSFYKSMNAEQRQSYVEEKTNELHRINNGAVAFCKRNLNEIYDDDLCDTYNGKFDISYNCDLFCIAL